MNPLIKGGISIQYSHAVDGSEIPRSPADMGVSKNWGTPGTPKWMVKIMVPNPIKMDDLGGFPLFLETFIWLYDTEIYRIGINSLVPQNSHLPFKSFQNLVNIIGGEVHFSPTSIKDILS